MKLISNLLKKVNFNKYSNLKLGITSIGRCAIKLEKAAEKCV